MQTISAHPPQRSDPPRDPQATADGPGLYLETFGCQMNVLDSQLVTGQLTGLGYRFVDDWHQADVILYNTCSVREHAEQKVWSRVGEVGKHKREHPNVVLGVIGCMAERDGIEMARRYPQIDVLCGPGELDKVPTLVDNALRTSPTNKRGRSTNARRPTQHALQGNTHRRSATLAAAEDQLERIDLARSFSPDDQSVPGSAYVRITRGCNKFCTYCVVPHTRGAEVHRPPQHIVEECRRLVEAGAIEITLLGQTVNHYHFDHANAQTVNDLVQPQVGAAVKNRGNSFDAQGMKWEGPKAKGQAPQSVTTFADLLARIHDEIPGLQRLRFVTSFPRDFGDDILEVMACRPRICRYLHLPVQSGSDRMLKAMNRGYRVEEFLDLLDRVRAFMPDSELASDIICGFPGETEQDHQATAQLLRRGAFKNCFIFKYSPRPGTAAAKRFEDDVPESVKKRRNHELLSIQSEVGGKIRRSYIGRTVRVFVESISRRAKTNPNTADPSVTLGWSSPHEVTQLTGRTDGDMIVCFDGQTDLIGQIVEVRVEDASPLTLTGRLA